MADISKALPPSQRGLTSSPPHFSYMRNSHPEWTKGYPTWNGRYVHLLVSIPSKIQKYVVKQVFTFFIEAKGFDRQLLARLIPCLCPEVKKVGFNHTKLLLHLAPSKVSFEFPEPNEDFSSRFARFLKGVPVLFPPSNPADTLEVSDKLDAQIQNQHLRQFHYIYRKILSASLKQKSTTTLLLVAPFADRHLAKILVRSLDSQISPIVPHRSPDGEITVNRKKSVANEFYAPPPSVLEASEERQVMVEASQKKLLSLPLLQSVQLVVQFLHHSPPRLEQLQSIALDFFAMAPEGENTWDALLQSSILVFPFRVFLKALYYELIFIDQTMAEKDLQLQALIQILKQLLSKKDAAMQSFSNFLQFFEKISNKEIQRVLIEICGGQKFFQKLKKLKALSSLEKEGAQIRAIHRLTFKLSFDTSSEVTGDITPKKVVRSIFPDRHSLWQITINTAPFDVNTDEKNTYLQQLIQSIHLTFRDNKSRSPEEEALRLLEGVKVNERIDTSFRNGRVIRKIDSDAFPILQRMTVEAWGPANALLHDCLPRVFNDFHLRRQKIQTQLCDVQIESPDTHQVTHKYAYILYEQLTSLAPGIPYATMTLVWNIKTPSFLAELTITDFSFTPELNALKNAAKLKQHIFDAFLSPPSS